MFWLLYFWSPTPLLPSSVINSILQKQTSGANKPNVCTWSHWVIGKSLELMSALHTLSSALRLHSLPIQMGGKVGDTLVHMNFSMYFFTTKWTAWHLIWEVAWFGMGRGKLKEKILYQPNLLLAPKATFHQHWKVGVRLDFFNHPHVNFY